MQRANFSAGVTPLQAAVATDAVTTAYHAVKRRADVKATDLVLLFGLGGLGFNALQIIRAIGARVIVSEIRQELLEAAEKLGIPKSDIIPLGKSPVEFLEGADIYEKIDTVIDFVGTHQTFEDSQLIGESYSSSQLQNWSLTENSSQRREDSQRGDL